jgi:hypothetical protein
MNKYHGRAILPQTTDIINEQFNKQLTTSISWTSALLEAAAKETEPSHTLTRAAENLAALGLLTNRNFFLGGILRIRHLYPHLSK